ncbi:hypothetical protein DFH09DRAFT_477158 [Mycena vulgaris]|nr:hypothetical protein DFH09DRAFT_477158 [Mycena vulgaris]
MPRSASSLNQSSPMRKYPYFWPIFVLIKRLLSMQQAGLPGMLRKSQRTVPSRHECPRQCKYPVPPSVVALLADFGMGIEEFSRAVCRARHGHGCRFDGSTTAKSVLLPSRREANQRLHRTERMTGWPSRLTRRARLPDSRATQVTRQETHGDTL